MVHYFLKQKENNFTKKLTYKTILFNAILTTYEFHMYKIHIF